ncbi:helix-turn-helix transcriptional regulator [Flocculibacter collagenilyticus]|uniref:helix-turn-helix transcriptional regulator n=1 Tax=Flocculibacter collagenilyticus TaxID=2744479 RepID=UPI0018F3189A|nr:helix-turn-helix transcriptional regulator [Flocculibacter collagenilyticus]
MDELSKLADILFTDGVEQNRWSYVASYMAQLFEANHCVITLRDVAIPESKLFIGMNGQHANKLSSEISNPTHPLFSDYVRNSKVGKIITKADIIVDEANLNITNLADGADIDSYIVSPVFRDNDVEGLVTLTRGVNQKPFDQKEMEGLKGFLPIFRWIFLLVKKNHEIEQASISQGIVNAIDVPTALIKATGEIESYNQACKSLIDNQPSVWVEQNKLGFEQSNIGAELQAYCEQLASETQPLPTKLIKVAESSWECTIKLKSIVLPSSDDNYVLLSVNNQNKVVRRKCFKELFKLSPAESEIAVYLSLGLSLGEVAEIKNTSKHTVRSQLKGIFRKTSTHSQNELIALLNFVC